MKKLDDANIIITVMHLKHASFLLKDYEDELSIDLLKLAKMLLSTYNIELSDIDDTNDIISSYDDIDETESIS